MDKNFSPWTSGESQVDDHWARLMSPFWTGSSFPRSQAKVFILPLTRDPFHFKCQRLKLGPPSCETWRCVMGESISSCPILVLSAYNPCYFAYSLSENVTPVFKKLNPLSPKKAPLLVLIWPLRRQCVIYYCCCWVVFFLRFWFKIVESVCTLNRVLVVFNGSCILQQHVNALPLPLRLCTFREET